MEYVVYSFYVCLSDKYVGCGFGKKDSYIFWYGIVFVCKEIINGLKWFGLYYILFGWVVYMYGNVENYWFICGI